MAADPAPEPEFELRALELGFASSPANIERDHGVG